MTDQEQLEQRYRRLLKWYPAAYRQENDEELTAVLMACARAGQRRPGLVASVDLIKSGLWMRFRPRVPRASSTVRRAVLLMYAGAIFTAVSLIVAVSSLNVFADTEGLRLLGHNQPLPISITVGVVVGLALITLWLWLARAVSQGRRGARVLCTVLVAPATLHLFGLKGMVSLVFAIGTWLIGLAAVWLLWRPDSRAFFHREDVALALRPTASQHQTP
jgi:hypothetical protein